MRKWARPTWPLEEVGRGGCESKALTLQPAVAVRIPVTPRALLRAGSSHFSYENDIATLLQTHKPAIEPLLVELAAYLSESDLTQVKQTVTEIRERISRFEDRK